MGFLIRTASGRQFHECGRVKKIIEDTYTELQQHAGVKREKVGKLELAAVMAAKTESQLENSGSGERKN